MGLFGGGNSSSVTENKQFTTQLGSEGDVAGKQLIGAGDITYLEQVPESVTGIFSELTTLAGESAKSASSFGRDIFASALSFGKEAQATSTAAQAAALQAVQSNVERTSQPEASLIRDNLPLFIIGGVVTLGLILWRK